MKGSKQKVEQLKIFAKKCRIENSGEKRTLDKNLKREMDKVVRLRRLSC